MHSERLKRLPEMIFFHEAEAHEAVPRYFCRTTRASTTAGKRCLKGTLELIQIGEHNERQTIRLVYYTGVRTFWNYHACCRVYYGTTNAHRHRCAVGDYGTSLFYCIRYCKEEEEVRALLET